MIYSVRQIREKLNSLNVAILFASVFCTTALNAQTRWTHVANQPVFDYGTAGAWDNGAVFWPTVIKDGDTLRMWYAGSDDVLGFGRTQIGYTWSLNGISWFRYAPRRGILSAELFWESGIVVSPTVIKDDNEFKMWYGAAAVPPRIIGYATSDDGISWQKRADPVLQPGSAGDWDSSIIGPGAVTKENDVYKMWYWGGRRSWPYSIIQIGLAISDDGIHWVKHDDASTNEAPFSNSDPVLKVSSTGEWDSLRVWSPAVLATDAGYEMWYAGRDGPFTQPQLVGYATSPDGIHWEKSRDNPVIDTAPTWGYSYLTTAVLKFDRFYHLWYTSFTFANGGQSAKIGYATSPVQNGSASQSEIPEHYFLLQNYPNPFNNATTLYYELPERAAVQLVIYDTLGRLVKTLIRGVEEGGYKSVSWDGTDELGRPVNSGIYLYRIQAGIPPLHSGQIFTQTNRMLLIK